MKTTLARVCSNGISKTGVFCTLYNAVAAVNSGQGITSIAHTVGLLRQRRRGMVSTQDEYLFCHTALLYYAQDILVKRKYLSLSNVSISPCQNWYSKPSPLQGFATSVLRGLQYFTSTKYSLDIKENKQKFIFNLPFQFSHLMFFGISSFFKLLFPSLFSPKFTCLVNCFSKTPFHVLTSFFNLFVLCPLWFLSKLSTFSLSLRSSHSF